MLNTTHVQKTRFLRFHHLFSLSIVLLIVLMSASILFTFAQRSTGTYAASSTSFTFTAAGDYANTTSTTANLQLIARTRPQFNLALGDLNYGSTITSDQWSTYVKSYLLANFPFEIIAGNEDT